MFTKDLFSVVYYYFLYHKNLCYVIIFSDKISTIYEFNYLLSLLFELYQGFYIHIKIWSLRQSLLNIMWFPFYPDSISKGLWFTNSDIFSKFYAKKIKDKNMKNWSG